MVNRTTGLRVPLYAAKALAGTLQSFADASDDFSENRTCLFPARSGCGHRALQFGCLAAHAGDLGRFADEFGSPAIRSELCIGQQPDEKLVARIWDGTQNGGANPRVRGVAPGDDSEGIGCTRVSDFAESEGQLETDADVRVGGEAEQLRWEGGGARDGRGQSFLTSAATI